MSATRGLLGSMGASLSLIAAAACTLLAVSAVIALQGWPALSTPSSSASLSVDSVVHPVSASSPAAGAPLLVVVRAGAPVGATRPGGRPSTGSGPRTTGGGTGGRTTPIGRGPHGSIGTASSSSSSSARPTASNLVTSVRQTAGGVLAGATHSVSTAVAGVSPPLSSTVDAAGAAAAGVVSGQGQSTSIPTPTLP